jgi:hypothetical protein
MFVSGVPEETLKRGDINLPDLLFSDVSSGYLFLFSLKKGDVSGLAGIIVISNVILF